MDPALQELIDSGTDPNEKLEVIMRLVRPRRVPPRVETISRFGNIITCRIRRGDIRRVYASPLKISMKAARLLPAANHRPPEALLSTEELPARRVTSGPSGAGVVVAVIDYHLDFAHREFRRPDGSSRLLALWDQSHRYSRRRPNRYGYGRVFQPAEINRALRTNRPYDQLNYHAGRSNGPAHGTHVSAIAAGSYLGQAPDADLIFVHLTSGGLLPEHNLGDSVRLLEALDFVRTVAGDRKLVVNLSLGRHGGQKDGTGLLPRAIDAYLHNRRATMVCQSAGNYFAAKAHHSGLIRPGRKSSFRFKVVNADPTDNELEIWYSGRDVFRLRLTHIPSGKRFVLGLGEKEDVVIDGTKVGKVYHRKRDPNNFKNHIDLFLNRGAPAGEWQVDLSGLKITDGRYHAYLERDGNGQTTFRDEDVDDSRTIGSLAAGHNSLVVGAFEQREGNSIRQAWFSSSGPTVDGRNKPDLIAPGVNILSARSTALSSAVPTNQYVRMQGTSMAAPYVAGVCARVLEKMPRRASVYQIRRMMIGGTKRLPNNYDPDRGGAGLVSARGSLRMVRNTYSRRIRR